MVLELPNGEPKDYADNEFGIIGLNLEGSEWDYSNSKLLMSNKLFHSLPKVVFKWAKKNDTKETMFNVPVYLNTLRKQLLFSILINNESTLTNYDWYQRGIGLIGWNKAFEYKGDPENN